MSTRRRVLELLGRYESRNVTFVSPDGSWPIVWSRARDCHVWDTDGRKYLDLTAAFGVAAAGHSNPRVVRAGQRQMSELLHAMGDVHPHPLKGELARELSRLTFERWSRRGGDSPPGSRRSQRAPPARCSGKVIFGNSGFEAIEAALKTARLATGRPRIIAFEKAYHGLGYGTLNATHRRHFREPFRNQLREFGHFLPFPSDDDPDVDLRLATLERRIRRLADQHQIGAILVEPVQGRGGVNVPPAGFLPLLRRLGNEHGMLLIVDEIFTGFGRTGAWFASEHHGVVPDIICLGKALTGGFPLSACVGRGDLMDAAWPPSTGEAIHTSTFLGHPVGCAMALAQIEELTRRNLIQASAETGDFLLGKLNLLVASLDPTLDGRDAGLTLHTRGRGLLAGLEIRRRDGTPATAETVEVIKRMLRRGFILLPEGEHANVISLTPPLTVSRRQLQGAVGALGEELLRVATSLGKGQRSRPRAPKRRRSR